MMHLAMHDALNAVEPIYETYAFAASRPDASALAAASQAAHDVARTAYPEHSDRFGELHEAMLEDATETAGTARGLELGAEAAAAITAVREDDGFDAEADSYTPESDARHLPVYRAARLRRLRRGALRALRHARGRSVLADPGGTNRSSPWLKMPLVQKGFVPEPCPPQAGCWCAASNGDRI